MGRTFRGGRGRQEEQVREEMIAAVPISPYVHIHRNLKGALSQGFRRFLVLTVLKLVVGNFAHEKQYF